MIVAAFGEDLPLVSVWASLEIGRLHFAVVHRTLIGVAVPAAAPASVVPGSKPRTEKPGCCDLELSEVEKWKGIVARSENKRAHCIELTLSIHAHSEALVHAVPVHDRDLFLVPVPVLVNVAVRGWAHRQDVEVQSQVASTPAALEAQEPDYMLERSSVQFDVHIPVVNWLNAHSLPSLAALAADLEALFPFVFVSLPVFPSPAFLVLVFLSQHMRMRARVSLVLAPHILTFCNLVPYSKSPPEQTLSSQICYHRLAHQMVGVAEGYTQVGCWVVEE